MFGKQKTPSTTQASLEQQIEALLFYFAKELSYKELADMTSSSEGKVKQAVSVLQESYSERGLSIVIENKKVSLVTDASVASLISSLQKQEEEKPLSKAAMETLSVVAYHGPVTRPDIDYIRGVNSTYSIRNLLLRGLIEKTKHGTSIQYEPSIDTLQFMGVTKREDLPQYQEITKRVREVLDARDEEESETENNTEEQKSHGG